MKVAFIWSRFDFENRWTRVEQEMPIVAALMNLLGDEAINDVDELYKVTTPYKCCWFVVNEPEWLEFVSSELIEDANAMPNTSAKIMFAVITQSTKTAKPVFVQPTRQERRNGPRSGERRATRATGEQLTTGERRWRRYKKFK